MRSALPSQLAEISYRLSGHETFPCRYTWLPKAVHNLREVPALFSDEDDAMVRLGVGKNMVRSIRFWADAADVIQKPNSKSQDQESLKQPILLEKAKSVYRTGKPINGGGGDWVVSNFGNAVFGQDGHDPFLEDIKTLWLIHWKLSTSTPAPLFAWHYLLNFWHRPDFTRTEALSAFSQEIERLGKKPSAVTLDHHFTTFLHTYVPTRSKKGEVLEDNLDCPLVELELIQKVGERPSGDSNRHEASTHSASKTNPISHPSSLSTASRISGTNATPTKKPCRSARSPWAKAVQAWSSNSRNTTSASASNPLKSTLTAGSSTRNPPPSSRSRERRICGRRTCWKESSKRVVTLRLCSHDSR